MLCVDGTPLAPSNSCSLARASMRCPWSLTCSICSTASKAYPHISLTDRISLSFGREQELTDRQSFAMPSAVGIDNFSNPVRTDVFQPATSAFPCACCPHCRRQEPSGTFCRDRPLFAIAVRVENSDSYHSWRKRPPSTSGPQSFRQLPSPSMVPCSRVGAKYVADLDVRHF